MRLDTSCDTGKKTVKGSREVLSAVRAHRPALLAGAKLSSGIRWLFHGDLSHERSVLWEASEPRHEGRNAGVSSAR